jgi:hypothetical protein
VLNNEIESFHHSVKPIGIRKTLVPRNSRSLWKAVKVANCVNISQLLSVMYKNSEIHNTPFLMKA